MTTASYHPPSRVIESSRRVRVPEDSGVVGLSWSCPATTLPAVSSRHTRRSSPQPEAGLLHDRLGVVPHGHAGQPVRRLRLHGGIRRARGEHGSDAGRGILDNREHGRVPGREGQCVTRGKSCAICSSLEAVIVSVRSAWSINRPRRARSKLRDVPERSPNPFHGRTNRVESERSDRPASQAVSVDSLPVGNAAE